MALLTCEGLALGYEGKQVVDNLHFTVNAGDYLCIVGENGSGKTTLMRTLLGLLPPLSGSIHFGEGLAPGSIGYLPQQTAAQRDFPASVREVVLSGCLNQQGKRLFYTKEQKQKAQRNMQRLNIDALQRQCYRELSGGQQQRVLLARALCAADRMLLLDEPAAGLDPNITQDMYQLIAQLNQSGMTILMISHDIGAALQHASHILHIASTPLYFGETAGYRQSEAASIYARRGETK